MNPGTLDRKIQIQRMPNAARVFARLDGVDDSIDYGDISYLGTLRRIDIIARGTPGQQLTMTTGPGSNLTITYDTSEWKKYSLDFIASGSDFKIGRRSNGVYRAGDISEIELFAGYALADLTLAHRLPMADFAATEPGGLDGVTTAETNGKSPGTFVGCQGIVPGRFGQPAPDLWLPWKTRWSNKKETAVGSDESSNNGREIGRQSVRFRIRYTSGLQLTDRIQHDGLAYDIVDIIEIERRKMQDVHCVLHSNLRAEGQDAE